MDKKVAAANAVLLLIFAAFVLLYFDRVRERIFPPMFDDARSFGRVDPRPGWVDTGIDIQEGRPIGIIVSGKVSTPRLTHDTGSERNKPRDVGPEGAQVREELIPAWRELDDFPAFALLGRVNGGKPFLVARSTEVALPGRLELKINCPLWDKTFRNEPEPGAMEPRRRKGPLTDEEWKHLRGVRGFFAYRTWVLGNPRASQPHLPLTGVEITAKYGDARSIPALRETERERRQAAEEARREKEASAALQK